MDPERVEKLLTDYGRQLAPERLFTPQQAKVLQAHLPNIAQERPGDAATNEPCGEDTESDKDDG